MSEYKTETAKYPILLTPQDRVLIYTIPGSSRGHKVILDYGKVDTDVLFVLFMVSRFVALLMHENCQVSRYV